MANQNTNDQDNKQEDQQWLKQIETCIEEQQDELEFGSEAAYYEAVRDMLLHQGNSDEAISQAIKRCYDHSINSVDVENARYEEDGEEGPHKYDIFFLNSIARIVFETVRELPYLDPKTEILAQFLIKMAKNIPSEFRHEGADPALDFNGIQTEGRESWERFATDSAPVDLEGPGVEARAQATLNTAALLAKLTQADILGAYGPSWATHDLRYAFEHQTKGDITKHILKQAQILCAANYLLIAGDALAKAFTNRKFVNSRDITAEKWKTWTSKIKEMADAVDDDTRWNLKERLQKAHDKMVEIQEVL